jgi:hypothetical protein
LSFQRKLERLLQVFPQEPVEAKRWSKIANALGNRTPKQVRVYTIQTFSWSYIWICRHVGMQRSSEYIIDKKECINRDLKIDGNEKDDTTLLILGS